MKAGAERTVFAGFVGDPGASTYLYTFQAQGAAFSRVLRMRFSNVTDAPVAISVFVVPAGVDITAGDVFDLVQYAEVLFLFLAARGEDRSILEYEPESEAGGLKLRNGERLVAYCGIADAIAGRVEVEDVTA